MMEAKKETSIAPEREAKSSSTVSTAIDMNEEFDAAKMAGKTILITGGASGFGAAFAREWASHGANIIIGDINDANGEKLVAELRQSTGSEHHHYQNCDVTDWESQVKLFRTAAQLSPTGGIDAVVPNAGIGDDPDGGTTPFNYFENPSDMDRDHPPVPRLKVMDVNLIGVMYTIHLALFWLCQNDRYLKPDQIEHNGETGQKVFRDRSILLIGSIASVIPLVGSPQYTASKHAITGLFRSLRGTAFRKGIRINMLCPYFVDTGIVSSFVLYFLAGGGLGEMSDVVKAGSRFMADRKVFGRAVIIGPKMKVEDLPDGEIRLVEIPQEGDEAARGIWEAYLHDYEAVEGMVYRYSRLLVGYAKLKGWYGWVKDLLWISFYRNSEKK